MSRTAEPCGYIALLALSIDGRHSAIGQGLTPTFI